MARAGVQGDIARLQLDGDRLAISSSKENEIVVAAAEVSSMRLARFEPSARTRGFCEAKVWWSGSSPLYFSAMIDDENFAAVVGGFARRVAETRGVGALRSGPDLLSAIVMFALTIGSLSLLLAFLLYVALTDGGWWWSPLVAFAPLYLLALRAQLRNHWPRRLTQTTDLEPLLPRRPET